MIHFIPDAGDILSRLRKDRNPSLGNIMVSPLVRQQFAPAIQRVIERLYNETLESDPEVRRSALAGGLANEAQQGFYQAMAGARMPVTPEFGTLLYILARTSAARHIVEFGTSFGVSTLFLAAALQDNGGGRLLSAELLAAKADCAIANFREAGLSELIEVRIGDARETLARDEFEPIDVIVLDGDKNLYLDVLRDLEPRLRRGGLVISDRADLDGGDGGRAADYLSYLEDPSRGYRLATLSSQAIGRTFFHDVAVRA